MDDAQGAGVDLHHVEAGAGVGVAQLFQIPLSGPGQKKLFFRGDSVQGTAEIGVGSGLYLHEQEDARPPLPGHDVDLVAAVAPVSLQYAAAVAEEIPGGQPFPPLTPVHGTKWPMKLRRWMGQGPYAFRAAMCSAVP